MASRTRKVGDEEDDERAKQTSERKRPYQRKHGGPPLYEEVLTRKQLEGLQALMEQNAAAYASLAEGGGPLQGRSSGNATRL